MVLSPALVKTFHQLFEEVVLVVPGLASQDSGGESNRSQVRKRWE